MMTQEIKVINAPDFIRIRMSDLKKCEEQQKRTRNNALGGD